tara:strand:+ start:123 stop:536 length:414 start_codon:yes stop_codon:yes gene_type:complete
MKINKGYSIIELLLALCIVSILLPSMITVIISSFRYIAITLNQQLRIQDHLFIDHLMRQEIAKSTSYQFKNNTLTLFNKDDKSITYYIHQNKLKRRKGRVIIPTKQYLFKSMAYYKQTNQIVLYSEFRPIAIVLPQK